MNIGVSGLHRDLGNMVKTSDACLPYCTSQARGPSRPPANLVRPRPRRGARH